MIVFLVALHTLNVSVDTDFMTAHLTRPHTETFDDIDSISEFLLEMIFKDPNMTTESNNDDQHHHCHVINTQNSSIVLFYSAFPEPLCNTLVHQETVSRKQYTDNTKIQFEDHSYRLINPPDQLHLS